MILLNVADEKCWTELTPLNVVSITQSPVNIPVSMLFPLKS